MTCEELRDLFELYALGALEEEERHAIDEHLARNCPECTNAMRRAVAVNAVITSFAPEAAPPRQLRDRVLASVGATRRRQGFAWWPVWALASAGLLVATLTLGYRERETSQQLSAARQTINRQSLDLERSRQILSFLDQPETRQVGFDGKQQNPPRGNFFVNPRTGVLLIAQNLPRLDSGRTYQMWVIPKGANPRPAGLFQPDSAGTAVHFLTGAVDVATLGAVAISVEPENGSPQPTTTPIVVAPVAF
jgi:anti-sigma-K factor RskA